MLAAANVVGVVLFGIVYALAGTRRLSQAAFVSCLILVFGLVTAVWVRTEARHRTLHPLRRLGRAAVSLLAVIATAPAVVLMPLFWLERIVPPEAGLASVQGPIMALVLISLGLVVLTNVVGALLIGGRAALARHARPHYRSGGC